MIVVMVMVMMMVVMLVMRVMRVIAMIDGNMRWDSDKIATVMAIEAAMAMVILMETTSVISDVTVWGSCLY